MFAGWGPGGELGFCPSPAPGAGGPARGSREVVAGWDLGCLWMLEPQWGPEKFNFISAFLPGIFRLSLPLAVPDVWLWPV